MSMILFIVVRSLVKFLNFMFEKYYIVKSLYLFVVVRKMMFGESFDSYTIFFTLMANYLFLRLYIELQPLPQYILAYKLATTLNLTSITTDIRCSYMASRRINIEKHDSVLFASCAHSGPILDLPRSQTLNKDANILYLHCFCYVLPIWCSYRASWRLNFAKICDFVFLAPFWAPF